VKTDPARRFNLERLLALVLQWGTWLACAVIAVGLILALHGWPADTHALPMLTGAHVVTAGIALLILLPVLRVALMLIVFVIERDYRFGAIAALVLAIIFLGILVGMHRGA
jgi:uncharacterized membrane protein